MPGRRAAAQTGEATACASGLGSSAQSMAAAALLVAPCALLFVAKLQEPYMDEIFHIPQVPLQSVIKRLMPMAYQIDEKGPMPAGLPPPRRAMQKCFTFSMIA